MEAIYLAAFMACATPTLCAFVLMCVRETDGELLFSAFGLIASGLLLEVALDRQKPMYLWSVLVLCIITVGLFGHALVCKIYDKLQGRSFGHHP